ncbi:2-C-methyl-D-erythritol 4-phosphate cytidylyltransferase [Haloechinothrix sp. YIM 98757]|uniref:2-C-methyl-D-erythritol 4-phosphate cytidylyltransferase n=1 Tax=Haloechinothrix aidingensis TaxID=2752311 RepID=A0A838AES1_9PSEU|nr:2-C-methyl-D-erythritol 4-phosphate cytidylyltransferase [Haloechinothrix aidingensis]MBA0127834.1 2-C-methyl-D-erythritol 4-phosphate cytidylyltransferase [Haloechinothrix aidingensis]
MRIVAIVPAAGRGARLGAATSKALVPVKGVPLLTRAVRGLLDSRRVQAVVVAAPPQEVEPFTAAVRAFGESCRVVAGGADRTSSVRLALDSIEPGSCDGVLVHDAARAFTPTTVVANVLAGLEDGAEAAVPAVPVTDTVKVVDSHDVITATPDRSALRAVQTPQGFAEGVLRRAHAEQAASTDPEATDDAGLVERLGIAVRTVPGDVRAMKITTPFDLAVAEAVLAGQEVTS